jgi:hypothetical protein
MNKQYQGGNVTIIRDAKQGDQGFDASKGAQTLIKLADGSQKTVLQSDLKDA